MVKKIERSVRYRYYHLKPATCVFIFFPINTKNIKMTVLQGRRFISEKINGLIKNKNEKTIRPSRLTSIAGNP